MLFTSKKLLLFDGFGAMLSALLLGMVLVRWQHLIGMPVQVLHILAAVAGLFSCYSFTSYFMTNDNWRSYLKGYRVGQHPLLLCYHWALAPLLVCDDTHSWYLLLHCRDHCGLFPRDN
jgi:hypothetical protein